MKKLFFLAVLLISVPIDKAIGQTIYSSIDSAYFFVNGISIGLDTLTANPDQTTSYVIFRATSPTGDTTYTIDTAQSSPFQWSEDISTLNPGAIIWAEFYSNANAFIDASDTLHFNIIAKPIWLVNGSVSNVNISGDTLSFQGTYPIYTLDTTISSSVDVIGNDSLNLAGNFIFYTQFDMSNDIAAITSDSIQIQINILNQLNYTNAFSDSGVLCQMNPQLNLTFTVLDSISTPQISLKIPAIQIPISTGITVSVDAGFSLYGTLKGQVVLGQDSISGQWGFINSNGQQTKIIGVLSGDGFVRGTVDVLYGVASATATLDAHVDLGAGFNYVSLPSSVSNDLLGGDLNVSGQIDYSIAWGLSCGTVGPQNFFYNTFGDTSAIHKVGSSFESIFETKSSTFQRDGTTQLPSFNPQPAFGSRNDNLYTVWLDNANDSGYVLFARLKPNGSAFYPQKVVAVNQNIVSNPKVAILPDSSAIITWSQSSYNINNAPNDIDSMLGSQDVWMAFYDYYADSITYVSKLSDTTGRADGNATIAVGSNNEAIITWVSRDVINGGSDVWYTYLVDSSGTWFLNYPAPIADLDGSNYEVHVAYTDSLDALAVWVHDPDASDSTRDNDIFYSLWNDNSSTWTTPDSLTSNPGTIQFKEVVCSANDGYTGIAFTSTYLDNNNDFINRVDMYVWDEQQQQWDTSSSFYDTSSLNYFQLPRVSISQSGIESACYQAVSMFPDTAQIGAGQLNLVLKDLTSASSTWYNLTGPSTVSLICDTTAFIWHLDAGFGGDNRFYTLTQEYNSTGIVTVPNYGVLFGNPQYSMVLRGLIATSDSTVAALTLPDSIPTGIKNVSGNENSIWYINYPNPFAENTILKFQLTNGANVQLDVFDLEGKQITRLVDSNLPPGIYDTQFSSGDLPSGFYFAKLTVNNQSTTHKMVIVK